MIRIGLVGAGFIAARHVDSLTGIPGVIVGGIADPRRDRAEELAARAASRAYPDLATAERPAAAVREAGLLTAVGYHLLPRGVRIGIELVAPGLGLWLTEYQLTVSDGGGERTREREVDPIAAEDRAFVDAVRGMGDDVRAPYGEALRTHRLATAVAAVAGGGGTVHQATGPRR